MKELVKTVNMDRQEWLKWRSKGIGGSDASVIAGVNPFKSVYTLWKEKTGQIELAENENDFMHFGNLLEPVVKQEFTRRTGLKVRAKRAILQSSQYPFMLADLDGIINDHGEMCIFEAKTASAYKQEVWEKGVPREYVLQVQHYMAVTGFKKAYVAAIVGGNQFFCHVILRDEVMIRKLIEMEKSFWSKNVLAKVEPMPDGSSATTAYLNSEYRESNGVTVELPPEVLHTFERYDEIVEQMEKLKAAKEAVSNELKFYLKDNEKGKVGDRYISWKSVHARRLDQSRLKDEKPEVYEAYLAESSYRKLQVA